MYEGGAEFASRPSKPINDEDDDDDIRSGNFHTELREQFNNAKKTKKQQQVGHPLNSTVGGGILKSSERPQTACKRENEYQKRYDDYYQDGNNIVFHTGTFNGEEDENSN
jgi:hypothetical protein